MVLYFTRHPKTKCNDCDDRCCMSGCIIKALCINHKRRVAVVRITPARPWRKRPPRRKRWPPLCQLDLARARAKREVACESFVAHEHAVARRLVLFSMHGLQKKKRIAIHAREMRALDVHTYDGKHDPRAVRFAHVGPADSFDASMREVIDFLQREGVRPPSEMQRMRPALQAYALMDPVDPVNGVDAQRAFAVAWRLVRADCALRQLFYGQMDDMIRTSGTCAQGRTARMLQIIAALSPDDLNDEDHP